MSSCPLPNAEEPEGFSEKDLRRDREYYLCGEMRGTIRAALLPLLLSDRDLFSPVDVALGLDRRKILVSELEAFIKLLELKLEDVYGQDSGGDCCGAGDDPGGAGTD